MELELFPVEVDVVESPDGCGKDRGHAPLSLHHLEHKVDSLFTRISGGPRLAGHCVWRVSVSTHALPVNPRLGDGVTSLHLIQTEHLRHDGGRGNLDVDNMVNTDTVERVLQSQASLDLVGLDHPLQHITDLEDFSITEVASSPVGLRDPIRYG